MTEFYSHHGITNHLLRSLEPTRLEQLIPVLEPVELVRGQAIHHLDHPIKDLYFVNRGLISFVKIMRDGRTVEIGAVGPEGVTDPTALVGMDIAIVDSVVQIPGTAIRVKRDIWEREMRTDPELLRRMQDYVRFAIIQIMQTAACNRLHSLDERCCRWLLIAHDSALADSFPLTHEFLAMMLGVQRSGVSIAASALQRAGLVRYARGRMTILDRAGLEDAACECYDAVRAEFEYMLGRHEDEIASAPGA